MPQIRVPLELNANFGLLIYEATSWIVSLLPYWKELCGDYVRFR